MDVIRRRHLIGHSGYAASEKRYRLLVSRQPKDIPCLRALSIEGTQSLPRRQRARAPDPCRWCRATHSTGGRLSWSEANYTAVPGEFSLIVQGFLLENFRL